MKLKLEKYISSELIKWLFPLFISLLWFCCHNFYSHSKEINKLYKNSIAKIDSSNITLRKALSLEELSTELLKKSGYRNIMELKAFFFLSNKSLRYSDSIKAIPALTSKLKFQISEDKGRLNKYSTLNSNFANQSTFKTFSELLDLELVFINNIDEYYQFKVASANNSDEKIFKQSESSCFVLYSKLTEIGARLNPADINEYRNQAKKEMDDERKNLFSDVDNAQFLMNLSEWGILFSTIFLILLTVVSFKYRLFGKQIKKQ